MTSHVFPQFGDGDVEIHFNETEKYVLHSYVLALHSPWFKASLSERWNSGAHETATENGKNHWIYELRFDKDTNVGLLVRKTSEGMSATRDTEWIEIKSENCSQETPQKAKDLYTQRIECLKAHQDMLGVLYYVPPHFSQSSFEPSKSSILQLAHVAKVYGCEPLTKLHIDNHLHLNRSNVLSLCADDPVVMLELGMALKSEWIFMEAATNLLGHSEQAYESAQRRLKELQLAALLNEKRSEFKVKLQACELALLRIQPSNNDSPSVLAVAFFRQWMTEELGKGYGSVLQAGYAKLYRTIGKGGHQSRDPLESGRMINYVRSVFGTNVTTTSIMPKLNAVFSSAAKELWPILQDNTLRQNIEDDSRSLLFMSVSKDELPWKKK